MDKDKIKDQILDDLSFGIPVSNNKYGIGKEEFLEVLNELQNDGLVIFSLIEDHPVFEGEPKNIRLTDKGKEHVKSKREP